MKYKLLIAAWMLFTHVLSGQVIYVSSSFNDIYRLDLDDCSYTLVTTVNRQVYDIAFHPNGTLYGIAGNGNFYSIDTLTGSTILLHDFAGQVFNSLTIGSDGIVYTIGNIGQLWTYNLTTDVSTSLGFIGFGATGDLTFYDGELYVAVSGDRIVKISINMPSNSYVVINEDIPGSILGIVSDVVDCTEINCYAITNGDSDIYRINFETNELVLVCELNITVGGGASTSEFLGSSPLKIDSLHLSQPDCRNQNGEAMLLVSGGSGSYSYSLNGNTAQTSNIFSSLPEGMYTLIVNELLGCKDTILFSLLREPSPTIDTLISKPTTCDINNGILEVVASGGTGPYLYAINGNTFQPSNVFTSLASGPYDVIVSDQSGCMDSMSFLLPMAAAPVITNIIVEDETCGNNNGSIELLTIGGTGNLTYSLDDIEFQSSPLFTNLSSGLYTAFVVDSSDCRTSQTIALDSLPSTSISTVILEHVGCGQVSGGSIEIIAEMSDGILYSLDGIQFQAESIFNNLVQGNYITIIQDENGCRDSMAVELYQQLFPEITGVIALSENCKQKDGSISITGIGGLPPYQYSLDGLSYQLSNTFANLSAGNYEATILDSEGCASDTAITVNAIEGSQITDINITPAACGKNTGTLDIAIDGGIPPLLLSLNGNAPQVEKMFTNLLAGDYTIEVVDSSGCMTDTMITLPQTACTVYIPNIFSPNGDGTNDFFRIHTTDKNEVLITRFFIFDRWGNSVYEKYNMPIQSEDGWWDGTYKRFTMNPGVYAYYLEVEFEGGQRETFKGNVTLVK